MNKLWVIIIILLIYLSTAWAAILDQEAIKVLDAVDPTGTIAYSTAEDVQKWIIKDVYVYVDNLNSSNITITIDAQPASGAGWITVWSKTYTVIGGDVVPVAEQPYALRISYQSSGDAANDSVTVYIVKKVEK